MKKDQFNKESEAQNHESLEPKSQKAQQVQEDQQEQKQIPNQDQETRQSENKKNVIFYALSMALGTMSSRVLGLLRDVACAALFDRMVTDAWTAAFRLPNLFRRLLGEGSLSISFIPVFIEAQHEDSQQKKSTESIQNIQSELTATQNEYPNSTEISPRAQNLVNGFYTILLGVLVLLTTLGILYTENVLKILLETEYIQNTEKFLLTVRMAKIMFGFIFFMSHFAYFMGILNALGEYSLPAMAPLFFNLAMIVSTILPQSWFASPGDGIAWGVIIGGFWQMAVLVPRLKQKNYFPRLSLNIWTPDVKRVFQSMAPGLLGTGLLQLTTIINTRFGSQLGEGVLSYIFWADRLLELPLSLVSVSLGTALLPTLSKMWSENRKDKMLETSNHYLRLNLFLCLPAAVGLFVLAEPLVEVMFRRGKFNAQDLQITASVVQIYAFILISSSLVRVLVPVYFAMKNTKWPSIVSGICLGIHFLLAPILMKRWGVQGLVTSSFISASFNFLLLALPIGFIVGSYGWRTLVKCLFKNGFSSLIMGVMLLLCVNYVYNPYHDISWLVRTVILLGMVFLGALVFASSSYFLRSEEFLSASQSVGGKLKTKLKKIFK